MGLVWIVPVSGVVAVIFAMYLMWDVLRRDTGSDRMKDIADRILEGAKAFISRQYRTIAILALFAAVAIALVLALVTKIPPDINGDGITTGDNADKIGLGWRTAVAFLVGAFCSGLAGIVGMYVSVKANLRTAAAATRGLGPAVQTAMRGGAVSGFLIVALSLLGVTAMFYAFGGNSNPELAPFLIVGFGFGASFVALFSQLGGGIYTKAADMGADLVGKVEAGIPEDDPRNPAVIADLVGDNVGDCAGRGADLFESTAAENIGAMILGVVIYLAVKDVPGIPHPEYFVLFPLVVRSFGIFATALGILSIDAPIPFFRIKESSDPMGALNKGYFLAVIVSIAFLALSTNIMLGQGGIQWQYYFYAGLVGIATSVAFVFITQYYTEAKYRPVKDIANAAKTGPATTAVMGISVGFESTFFTAVVIGAALWASFWLGQQADIPGVTDARAGLFGTAVATMGMLMTAAYILAMDTFGPITDNANGVIEMSGNVGDVRRVTDRLDAVGNTTKALTKGYAVGSAGLAAFLLFFAYVDEVEKVLRVTDAAAIMRVDLSDVKVFIGALMGGMLVYLFSALAIRAVSKTAGAVIEEVRRQFHENPKIMTGEERPDYARCVDITARAGLREMVLPGVIAVAVPIIVGVVLRHEAMGAFLMIGTISGILLATVLNNSGGAWDNAKKFVESGAMRDEKGQVVLKGSQIHAAAVVGDTIGDPFKDTAGPSLHVLVKLLSTITLVLAPIFI
ncbi:MAG: V-type H(+)-translocating pyrophosphatase [Dehalococcoidia bacterium]|nr:V-type H(+)-translocating pyrophosphatase [Dehalococcoidia bacterium]